MFNGNDLVVVSAGVLIDSDRQILLAQRPAGKAMAGLWEFPGGKVENGETPEQTLVRELKEELRIEVDIDDLSPWTFASHTYRDFHLLMPVFLCWNWRGEVVAQEGQQIAWVAIREIARYPMPEADKPLLEALQGLDLA